MAADHGMVGSHKPQRDRRMDGKRYRVCDQEDGATAVEYALMASLIAGVIGVSVSVLGGKVLNLFMAIASIFP
jgi:pilus assembly protein Flp/PilA